MRLRRHGGRLRVRRSAQRPADQRRRRRRPPRRSVPRLPLQPGLRPPVRARAEADPDRRRRAAEARQPADRRPRRLALLPEARSSRSPAGASLVAAPTTSSPGHRGREGRIAGGGDRGRRDRGPEAARLADGARGTRGRRLLDGENIFEISPSGERRTVAGNGGSGAAPEAPSRRSPPCSRSPTSSPRPTEASSSGSTAADYAAIRRVGPDGRDHDTGGRQAGRLRRRRRTGADATLGQPPGHRRRARRQHPGGRRQPDPADRSRRHDHDGRGHREYRYNGDGIQATEANLGGFLSVAANEDGSFLIGDFSEDEQNRVRLVVPDGTIRTLAGMPSPESCEDRPYNGIQGRPGNDSSTAASSGT